MTGVVAGSNESFESLLKRFNKKVQQYGILAEAHRREHYEKPGLKRKTARSSSARLSRR